LAILFFIVAALAIWLSALMITRKNPVHSALMLVLTFCCLSLLYFMLGAPFLGVLQVIVYAGAIMVLFVFVIMLLAAERREAAEEDPLPGVRRAGYLFATIFAILMTYVAWHSPSTGVRGSLSLDQIVGDNTQQIGIQLFGHYLLPFEVTSILLLVAMIGAIVLAKRQLD
jgi:NADH-quinone oxidoreductase subunit J